MQDIEKIESKLHPYSIGGYFDADSEAAIRAVWAKLAAAELADYLFRSNHRPHITFANFNDLQTAETHTILETICRSTPPIQLSFQFIGVFPTTSGIFLGPVVTKPLLTLHQKLHDALRPIAAPSESPYYLPENWVPHCGVAVEVEADHIPAAVQLIQNSFSFPFNVTLEEISINTIPAENRLCCYRLGV